MQSSRRGAASPFTTGETRDEHKPSTSTAVDRRRPGHCGRNRFQLPDGRLRRSADVQQHALAQLHAEQPEQRRICRLQRVERFFGFQRRQQFQHAERQQRRWQSEQLVRFNGRRFRWRGFDAIHAIDHAEHALGGWSEQQFHAVDAFRHAEFEFQWFAGIERRFAGFLFRFGFLERFAVGRCFGGRCSGRVGRGKSERFARRFAGSGRRSWTAIRRRRTAWLANGRRRRWQQRFDGGERAGGGCGRIDGRNARCGGRRQRRRARCRRPEQRQRRWKSEWWPERRPEWWIGGCETDTGLAQHRCRSTGRRFTHAEHGYAERIGRWVARRFRWTKRCHERRRFRRFFGCEFAIGTGKHFPGFERRERCSAERSRVGWRRREWRLGGCLGSIRRQRGPVRRGGRGREWRRGRAIARRCRCNECRCGGQLGIGGRHTGRFGAVRWHRGIRERRGLRCRGCIGRFSGSGGRRRRRFLQHWQCGRCCGRSHWRGRRRRCVRRGRGADGRRSRGCIGCIRRRCECRW